MKTKPGRQFLLSLLACTCLCGAALAQTARRGARPAAAAPTQQGARAVERVTAPQGWQRYEIHYAGGLALRVVLPSAPEVDSNPIPMGTFPPARQYLFTSTDASGVYIAGYLEGLPPALVAQSGARESFFNGLWKGMAEGMSGELKKQGLPWEVRPQPPRELSVGGHRAQVQDFTVGDLSGSARAVLAGTHSYMLLHVSLTGAINPEGHSFLDSFDLRPKR